MSTQAALKAGGIGAGVMVVLALLGLIPVPFLGCLCCLVVLGAWIGDGLLAVYFMPAGRTTGAAAGTGALAGLLSGVGYSLVVGVAGIIRAFMGGAAGASSYLTPEMLQQLEQAGIDPATYSDMFSFMAGTGGAFIGAGLCCVGALAMGAALGAVGGAIGAAVLTKRAA